MKKTIITLTIGMTAFFTAVSCQNSQSTNTEKTESKNENAIFPKGERAGAEYFTGTVWTQSLFQKDKNFDSSILNVTFEQGARTKWHTHPAGQILLVTAGKGIYQEKGKPAKSIKKGDVIVCDSEIEHWHGAASDGELTHIAITNFKENVNIVPLNPVTDEEYNTIIN